MKFTLGWLKEHLDTDASLDTIVETLTRIGLEVEGVENPGEEARGVQGRARAHRRAAPAGRQAAGAVGRCRRRARCRSCAARPMRAPGWSACSARRAPMCRATASRCKVAAIRGVESNGMMCSTRELELGDDHDGIIELPADAPVGASYRRLCRADRSGDRRQHHAQPAGLHGRARHRARSGGGGAGNAEAARRAYRRPVSPIAGEGPGPDVRTDDPEGCPAFYAQAVRGVTNGDGARHGCTAKLRAIGQKPISALVDITNFVMVDLGRPLHVYDRAKLQRRPGRAQGARRRAGAGAQRQDLYARRDDDGDRRRRRVSTTSAASWAASIRACPPTTTDVLIECAYFDPDGIARTGQKLAPDHRRAPAVRARRRSGVPRRRARHRHPAGARACAAARRARSPAPARRRSRRHIILYDPRLCRDARRPARRAGTAGAHPRSRSAFRSRDGLARSPCRPGAAISTARPIWSRR